MDDAVRTVVRNVVASRRGSTEAVSVTPPQGWHPVQVPAPTYTLVASAPKRAIEELDDETGPSAPVPVIVGWGPYAKRLALLKRESPARTSITLTGSVPAEELPGHVAMGDVFAMPCRTRGRGLDVEGLGIVFLEASACAVPVIAGDSGGAPKTVVEDVSGNVVGGLDQDALIDALVAQLTQPELRERMGRAGRRLMQEQWTWPTLVERLVEAIDAR